MAVVNINSRIPFVNIDDGTLTPEAYRALNEIINRTGGTIGAESGDTYVTSFDDQTINAQQSAGGDISSDVVSVAESNALLEMFLQPHETSGVCEMLMQSPSFSLATTAPAAATGGGGGTSGGGFGSQTNRDDLVTLVNTLRDVLINAGLMTA